MVWKDRNPATRFNLIHYTSCKCLFCLLKLFKQPSRTIHLCSKRQCVSVGKVNLQEIHKTSAFKHGFSCCLCLSLSNKQQLCPGFQKSLRGHTVAAFAGSFWGAKFAGCDMGGNIPQRTCKPWKIFGLQIKSSKRHRSVPFYRIFLNKAEPKHQLKEFGHDKWFMGLVYLLIHQHQISNIHVRKSTSPKTVLIWSQQTSGTIHNSWDLAEF